VIALAAGLAASCNPKVTPTATTGCVRNSDCDDPLICVNGECHTQCVGSMDCPGGEPCILTPDGGVCELPSESTDAGDARADDASVADSSAAGG
jgi:hypothetical protein